MKANYEIETLEENLIKKGKWERCSGAATLSTAVECMGAWASHVETFVFHLEVKPLGGFRAIALLAGPYRIWAKARMQIVREWAMTFPRAYFAAGAG